MTRYKHSAARSQFESNVISSSSETTAGKDTVQIVFESNVISSSSET